MIIAIDGTSGAGKGTLARLLAEKFGLAHLDTGLLYRAVAWRLLQADTDLSDIAAITQASQNLSVAELANPQLRRDEVASTASKIAALSPVRTNLLDFQRQFASSPPAGSHGAVLDGRDIGTVILPNADIKLYLTASPEARAQRRDKELQNIGIKRIYSSVLKDMEVRDQRDAQRAISPMKPAADALVIDTSGMDIAEVFDQAVSYILDKRKLAS